MLYHFRRIYGVMKDLETLHHERSWQTAIPIGGDVVELGEEWNKEASHRLLSRNVYQIAWKTLKRR
jgi:hypothetical protein